MQTPTPGEILKQTDVVTNSRSKIPVHTFNLLANLNHQPPNERIANNPLGSNKQSWWEH